MVARGVPAREPAEVRAHSGDQELEEATRGGFAFVPGLLLCCDTLPARTRHRGPDVNSP